MALAVGSRLGHSKLGRDASPARTRTAFAKAWQSLFAMSGQLSSPSIQACEEALELLIGALASTPLADDREVDRMSKGDLYRDVKTLAVVPVVEPCQPIPA